MVIFGDNNESLTKRDIKFLLGSFTVIPVASVLGLYLYNDIFKMHWTRRNEQEYYGQTRQLKDRYIQLGENDSKHNERFIYY